MFISEKRTTRAEAIKLVARYQRPESISPRLWPRVQVMLFEIAHHYPNSFPSERTLALATECSIPTVKRYIRMASEAGLLTRHQRTPRHGEFGSNQYLLSRDTHRGSILIPGPGITGDPLTTANAVGIREEALRASSLPNIEPNARPPAGRGSGAAMINDDQPDDPSRPRGEPALGEWDDHKTETRTTARKLSRYDQVINHVRGTWAEVCSRPTGEHLTEYILFDSVEVFRKRLKEDCFGRENRTVEQVCHSFDQFLEEVYGRSVSLKPGQSVWQRWWPVRSKYYSRYIPQTQVSRDDDSTAQAAADLREIGVDPSQYRTYGPLPTRDDDREGR